MRKNHKVEIIYEPEDDVLNIWLSKKLIEYGEDNGELVITHYTKDREPVYIEVLFASRFWEKKGSLKTKRNERKTSKADFPIAIPHRIK